MMLTMNVLFAIVSCVIRCMSEYQREDGEEACTTNFEERERGGKCAVAMLD